MVLCHVSRASQAILDAAPRQRSQKSFDWGHPSIHGFLADIVKANIEAVSSRGTARPPTSPPGDATSLPEWRAQRAPVGYESRTTPRPVSPEELRAVGERNTESKKRHMKRLELARRRGPLTAESSRVQRRRSPSPPPSPGLLRSPRGADDKCALPVNNTFSETTTSRSIHVYERKAFGHDPVPSRGEFRLTGPRSARRVDSVGHLQAVHRAAAHRARLRNSDAPSSRLASPLSPPSQQPAEHYTPVCLEARSSCVELAKFFDDAAEQASGESLEDWARSSSRSLTASRGQQRSRSPLMYSPTAAFHGVRLRTPSIKLSAFQ
jgi:hypothetical protein